LNAEEKTVRIDVGARGRVVFDERTVLPLNVGHNVKQPGRVGIALILFDEDARPDEKTQTVHLVIYRQM